MKKVAHVFLAIFVLSIFFSTDVFALSYDSNRYYWDCEAIIVDIDQIEGCLKKRLIPLNYYPYLGASLLFFIGLGFLSKNRRKQ